MKVSLNWLKQYVNLDGVSTDELKRAVTFLGFEVEGVTSTGLSPLQHVFVGEIKTRDKHPNADKLSVCTVDVGATNGGIRTIVCGAHNCDVGCRVPVALPGAVLPGNFKIKQSKIRGQASDGMMCAAAELGLNPLTTLTVTYQPGNELSIPVKHPGEGLLILDSATPVGISINEALPNGDIVLDIEITPNRPDALSHLGIARELAAWFRKDVTYPEIKFSGNVGGALCPDILADIRVEAPEDCPLYIGIAIAGVKVGPSPQWMQDRLKAVGLRPINNLVDVGNYVMLEQGQPLHIFDAKKIAGHKILIRRAADGEKLTTLDGKERALNHHMLVIADAAKPLVVAGIMGGADAGVDASTTDVILEAAYFRPQLIRWTSRQLGLASDSSYRFERGVDPHSTLEAARRAVDLLIETVGGTVVGPSFQVGGDRPWSREITIEPTYVNQKIGFEIPIAEQRAALEALGLNIVRETPDGDDDLSASWTVAIPSYRGDLDRPIDLVEEVLRVYGTEKVPVSLAVGPALVDGDDAPTAVFNRKVTDYLVGQHFHECVSYTLRSAKELRTWVSDTAVQELGLLNPFVEEQSHLRSSLLLGLMESLQLNQSRGNHVTHLAETGRVFLEHGGTVFECAGVGFIIAEDPKSRAWLKRAQPDFYTVKRHMEIIAREAGVDLMSHAPTAVTGAYWGWQEGQSAAVGELKDGWTARFGLLNLAMVRAAGIEGRVWGGMFAILPEALVNRASVKKRHQRFRSLSNFPLALRDIALVFDSSRTAGEIEVLLRNIIHRAAGAAYLQSPSAQGLIVESVQIFDVYSGAAIPEGKKSVAFALSFRADDRTLTDNEVNAVFAKIQQDIAADGTVIVRD